MTATGASYASKTLIREVLEGRFDHGFTMERAYKDMLKASYGNTVELSEINKFQIGNKIVYMVRGSVTIDGKTQPIDRYIEIYADRYVEYTVMCVEPGGIDNIVQSVIATLVPQAGAYPDTQTVSEQQ